MIAKITTKGQVTIPKEIRAFLNVKPSDKIDFVIEENCVFIKPIKTLKDFRGTIPSKLEADINKERTQAKAKVSQKVIEEME
ncbi:AbrB/MazE/SpoVT family DNA-binding domain-containing protein [bacterium]|nr:AbrB/MazE/SpoVT family DNA-binding domain-containing protein [bacterium]